MYCELPKLTRCCFCMPLRRGLLIFGYLNILYSAIGVIVYSARIHLDEQIVSIAYDDIDVLDVYMNDALYCIDIAFNLVLIYGAHRQIVRCLKIFYYYTLATSLAMVILAIYFIYSRPYYITEYVTLSFTRCCLYIYLIILVRSLIEKLENTSGLTYENQLQEIVAGEIKDGNAVYPSLPAETD
ncbi:uncharacterized protein LOC123873351 [Maniola jurtina]|uniref:uncharacterized protein LOC123873351 n=1 Tax=Maniola jurtina TaxID=191418 RepID=UPI001E68B8A5|nr:uncharacterized protein LOC123873351 [Maniola jurtina]